MPRNGYGHMVLDDYVARVRAVNADRAKTPIIHSHQTRSFRIPR